MDAKSRLAKADNISFDLQCGVCALGAVHCAMAEGAFAADGFVDALYCVYTYLYDKQKELQNLLDNKEITT